MKLRNFLLISAALTIIGCRGLYMPDYNRYSATHQNIEVASQLKTGMSMGEVQKAMGVKPVRMDTDGDTAVWQYCNTERAKSRFVALIFSTKTHALTRKNNYTIFWDETKDKVLDFGDVVVNPSTYQLSCEYVAQKMGVKDEKNIEIWFTSKDAQRVRNERRYDQLQAQQESQQVGHNRSAEMRQQEEQRMRQREQYNRVNGFR